MNTNFPISNSTWNSPTVTDFKHVEESEILSPEQIPASHTIQCDIPEKTIDPVPQYILQCVEKLFPVKNNDFNFTLREAIVDLLFRQIDNKFLSERMIISFKDIFIMLYADNHIAGDFNKNIEVLMEIDGILNKENKVYLSLLSQAGRKWFDVHLNTLLPNTQIQKSYSEEEIISNKITSHYIYEVKESDVVISMQIPASNNIQISSSGIPRTIIDPMPPYVLQCIKHIFSDLSNAYIYTLREAIIEVLFIPINTKSLPIEPIVAFKDIFIMLHANNHDADEFNKKFKILFDGFNVVNKETKLYLFLLSQAGRKWFDIRLDTLFSNLQTQNSYSEEEMILNKITLYSAISRWNAQLIKFDVEKVVDVYMEAQPKANRLIEKYGTKGSEKSRLIINKLEEEKYQRIKVHAAAVYSLIDSSYKKIHENLNVDPNQQKKYQDLLNDCQIFHFKNMGNLTDGINRKMNSLFNVIFIDYYKIHIHLNDLIIQNRKKFSNETLLEAKSKNEKYKELLKKQTEHFYNPAISTHKKYTYDDFQANANEISPNSSADENFRNLVNKVSLLVSLQDLIIDKIEELCQQYTSIRGETNSAALHRAISWYHFHDELEEKLVQTVSGKSDEEKETKTNTHSKKSGLNSVSENNNDSNLSKIKRKATRPKQIYTAPTQLPTTPKETVDSITASLPQLTRMLAKEIRHKLKQQRNVAGLAGLSDNQFIRAKVLSKEVRDHLGFVTSNVVLFLKAVFDKDLYALGSVIKFFSMDLNLTLEQVVKHHYTINGLQTPVFHDLESLCSHADLNIPKEIREFIHDFSNAMIQARYPIVERDDFKGGILPPALEWILYCKQLCSDINSAKGNESVKIDKEKILQLSTFVLKSYEHLLKFLCTQLDLETHDESATTQILKNLSGWQQSIDFAYTGCKVEISVDVLKTKHVSTNKSNQSVLEIFKKLGQSSCNKGFNGPIEASQCLEQAESHIQTLDSSQYLQQKYGDLQFIALHHRNHLIFQWIFEQLFMYQGITTTKNDLRHVKNHDLMTYEEEVFSKKDRLMSLDQFNFARSMHYNHEHYTPEKDYRKSKPMIQDLLKIRQVMKDVDLSDSSWCISKKGKSSNLTPIEQAKEYSKKVITISDTGTKLLATIIDLILTPPKFELTYSK